MHELEKLFLHVSLPLKVAFQDLLVNLSVTYILTVLKDISHSTQELDVE